MTQIQLAKAANTTQRAISYYETDRGFPPAPLVASFAQALGISADELLGIKPTRATKSERLNGDRRLWKRFQKMTSLPERDQRAVIRLINSLAGSKTQERASAKGEASASHSWNTPEARAAVKGERSEPRQRA